ncbi:dihydroorotate dehydrogenase-like protein [Acidihalobacter prosperus]
MDLSTTYLGLDLRHPIMASASPLSADLGGILQLSDAGASAIVMASIYEEDVISEDLRQARLLDVGSHSHPETSSYFPEPIVSQSALDASLETLRRASERAGVPIIASLNGSSSSGWSDIALQLEEAGASAIELNIYRIPTNFEETGVEIEQNHLDILKVVKSQVRIPVSVKLSPYFSSLGNMAMRLEKAGVDGLVLFNRFYGPDINLASLSQQFDYHLSNSYEIRYGLMWLSLLSSRMNISFAASSGIWEPEDVVKYLLMGANAVMTTSALIKYGPSYLAVLRDGLHNWMESRDLASLDKIKGKLSQRSGRMDEEELLRTQYHDILTSGRF